MAIISSSLFARVGQLLIIEQDNVVIYHSNCIDGFAAAWILKFLGPDTFFLPAIHGDKAPDVTGKVVYIVDFAYPREEIIRMHREADFLRVIDHHATSQKELVGLDYCIFDMNHSGAGLTWKYLTPEPMPILIQLVEDRDLWRWRVEGSRLANLSISTTDFTFEAWDRLATKSLEELVEEGRSINKYVEAEMTDCIYSAKIREYKGYHIPVVNCTSHRIKSDVGGKLAEGYPFSICWRAGREGSIYISLRSAEDGIDVGEFAKKYGNPGGGHCHAAGMRIPVKDVLHWFD